MRNTVECGQVKNSNLPAMAVSATTNHNIMKNDDVVFYVEYRKDIPSTIWNAVWRWQYRTRRAIARKVRMFFYAFTHKGLSL